MSKPSPDIPEEDKHLCQHDWKDLYGGEGIDNRDPNIALNSFYCTKCLQIRVKAWPRHRYYTSKEWLEEFTENKQGDDNVSSVS